MSEYDDLLPEEVEIVDVADEKKVERQGPKQVPGPNDEPLPALMKASDLLPAEPEIPVFEGEPNEELPPEPNFLIVRNAFGPGAHSVKFANGKPVGVWMREQEMTPEEVEEQLTAMGLDADLIAFFVRTRAGGIAADAQLAADPTVAAFAEEEGRREGEKAKTSEAFVAAYRKKMKERP